MTHPPEPPDLEAIRARYDETHAITGDAFGLIDKMRASCEDVPPLVNEVARLARELDVAKAVALSNKRHVKFLVEQLGHAIDTSGEVTS